MNRFTKNKRFIPLLIVLMLSLLPTLAFAADSGEDSLGLSVLLDWLINLIQGPLGKILAILALGVSLVAGVLRGNFGTALVAFGFAIMCYYGPNMVLGVFGATI